MKSVKEKVYDLIIQIHIGDLRVVVVRLYPEVAARARLPLAAIRRRFIAFVPLLPKKEEKP